MQRREMCSGAKFIQNLGRDELVREELRASMHNAMAHCYRRGINMFPNRLGDGCQRIALRLQDTFTLYELFSRGRMDMQPTVATSDAIGASGQQRLFVACSPIIHAKLQRRRAAVQYED